MTGECPVKPGRFIFVLMTNHTLRSRLALRAIVGRSTDGARQTSDSEYKPQRKCACDRMHDCGGRQNQAGGRCKCQYKQKTRKHQCQALDMGNSCAYDD